MEIVRGIFRDTAGSETDEPTPQLGAKVDNTDVGRTGRSSQRLLATQATENEDVSLSHSQSQRTAKRLLDYGTERFGDYSIHSKYFQ